MPGRTDLMELRKFKILPLSFIITLIFFNATNPVTEINDIVKAGLSGKVRSVLETRYTLQGSIKEARKDKLISKKYTTYNPEGYETGSTIYNNGQVYLTSKYIPDAEGKPIEMQEYNADGTLNLDVTYNYDDKGFKTEALYNWSVNHNIGEICENSDYYFEIIQNDLFTKVLYKNEYRGYCVQEDFLKANGDLSFRLSSKYDIHGNKLESAYFHGNERLSWITKYKYDRYNNLIESKVFKSNRIAVLSKYKYQFDEPGNWITRAEERDVSVNIFTAGLEQANILTERIIEYYE